MGHVGREVLVALKASREEEGVAIHSRLGNSEGEGVALRSRMGKSEGGEEGLLS